MNEPIQNEIVFVTGPPLAAEAEAAAINASSKMQFFIPAITNHNKHTLPSFQQHRHTHFCESYAIR
jgi:azurin